MALAIHWNGKGIAHGLLLTTDSFFLSIFHRNDSQKKVKLNKSGKKRVKTDELDRHWEIITESEIFNSAILREIRKRMQLDVLSTLWLENGRGVDRTSKMLIESERGRGS